MQTPLSLQIRRETHLPLHERAFGLYRDRDYMGLRELLEPVAESLVTEPELAWLLVTSRNRLGDGRQARRLARKALKQMRSCSSTVLSRRIRNSIAVSLFDRGRLAIAARLWEALASESGAVDDEQLHAWSLVNLGAIAGIKWNWGEALSAQYRAIALFHRLGDASGLVFAHANLGVTYQQLARHHLSMEHFDRASELAHGHLSRDDAAMMQVARARLLIDVGEPHVSAVLCAESLAVFMRFGNRLKQAEALRVLGIARHTQRDLTEARAHLDAALTCAGVGSGTLVEAEVHEELYNTLLALGEMAAAGQHARAAGKIYHRLGAAGRAERMFEAGMRDLRPRTPVDVIPSRELRL